MKMVRVDQHPQLDQDQRVFNDFTVLRRKVGPLDHGPLDQHGPTRCRRPDGERGRGSFPAAMNHEARSMNHESMVRAVVMIRRPSRASAAVRPASDDPAAARVWPISCILVSGMAGLGALKERAMSVTAVTLRTVT